MSNSQISTLVKVLAWLLMGVSVLMATLFFLGAITEEPFIILAYVLGAIATALAVIFPVAFFITYPKTAVKALMGIAALGLVFLIGFIFSDSTPIPSKTLNQNFELTSVLTLTDTGIFATYLLFGIAVMLLIFTGVRSIINK